MQTPRLSSTIMLLRPRTAAAAGADDDATGIEVFMLRRSARSSFVPNIYVFPGGVVEPSDGEPTMLARLRGARTLPIEPAIAVAAIRELFEEAGVLLACDASDAPIVSGVGGRRPSLEALARGRVEIAAGRLDFAAFLEEIGGWADARELTHYSRWITPPVETRRFDTHFFIARAPEGQLAEADAQETNDGVWIAPADALRRFADGRFAMIFPTIKHLERLAAFATPDEAAASAHGKRIVTVMPDVLPDRRFVVPSEIGSSW